MSSTAIRTVKLPSGDAVPALGQGTWYMGESAARRKSEIAALRLGIDLGMTFPIDTAEMVRVAMHREPEPRGTVHTGAKRDDCQRR